MRQLVERPQPCHDVDLAGELRPSLGEPRERVLLDERRLPELDTARDRDGLADRVEMRQREEVLSVEAVWIAVQPKAADLSPQLVLDIWLTFSRQLEALTQHAISVEQDGALEPDVVDEQRAVGGLVQPSLGGEGDERKALIASLLRQAGQELGMAKPRRGYDDQIQIAVRPLVAARDRSDEAQGQDVFRASEHMRYAVGQPAEIGGATGCRPCTHNSTVPQQDDVFSSTSRRASLMGVSSRG